MRPSPLARRPLASLAAAAGLAAAMHGQAPQSGPPVLYDLRPGDHLVYRERLDRSITGESSGEQVVVEWRVDLVATGSCPGCVVVGTERSRTSAQLVRAAGHGRSVTAADRAAFEQTLAARPGVTADANWIDPSGLMLLPPVVTREWRSPVLPGVREIEPLPAGGVSAGNTWSGRSLLNYQMTAAACPAPADADCLLLEGRSPAAWVRAWFSTSRRLITKQVVSGEYDSGGARVREEVTLELVDRRRDERLDGWLSSAETRAGALAALQVSPNRPVGVERLYALLDGADAESERQVLAVAWQWHSAPPPAGTLARLTASPHPRVRALAARFAGRPEDGAPRRPAGSAVRPTACAPSVERWTASRRFGREPPGATLRTMTSPGFAGWPYVVRIPDDYTGENPVPALIYLSGGSGLAVQGAQTAERALAGTGYLAVFPHADGLWWDERPGNVVRALIDEVVRGYNVDLDRVSVAGFSNGGTGALVFAARWPDRFAAAAPTMGAAIGSEVFSSFGSGLNTLPLLLQHGTADRVIPPVHAAENRRQLERQPRTAPFEVTLLPGRQHDVNVSSDDGRTIAFLDGQRRNPHPRTFIFETNDPAPLRRYWVEITGKGGGTARVDASIAADGSIDLSEKGVKTLRLLLRAETLPEHGPLVVRVNGREAFRGAISEDCALFATTLEELADPGRAYSATVEIEITGKTVKSRRVGRSPAGS